MYQTSFLSQTFSAPVDWSLLYDLSYNLETREVKLYFYNRSFDWLEKYSAQGLEWQFSLCRVVDDLLPLQQFLGDTVQLDDIYVDAVDFRTQTYWLIVEGSSPDNLERLYHVLLEKYELKEAQFLHWVNYLNTTNFTTLAECAAHHGLSCIRLPLHSKKLKIYARCFRFHSFPLDETTQQFLLQVLNCEENQLLALLNSGGVSYDFSDGRIVLFTQYDALRKQR